MKIKRILKKSSQGVEVNTSRAALLGGGDGEHGDGIAVGLAGDFDLFVRQFVELIERGLVAGIEGVHLVADDQGVL